MKSRRHKWTKETILESAKQFTTITAWSHTFPGARLAAQKLGIWKEVTLHMVRPPTHNFKWTKEKILAKAKEFNTIQEWVNASNSTYLIARGRGWFAEASAHMTRQLKTWTKEECIQDAKQYGSKTEWGRQNPNAYAFARRQKIINEFC